MRTRDRLRNLAERGIDSSGVFETILSHDDRVCPPAPFPNEPCPRPDAWTGIRSNAPARMQFHGQRYESPLSRFTEATIGKFLQAIGDSADKQVATQPRRVTPIQASPFGTELLGCQIRQRRNFSRQLYLRRSGVASTHSRPRFSRSVRLYERRFHLDLRRRCAMLAPPPPQARGTAGLAGIGMEVSTALPKPHARSSCPGSPVER
jgi:hypothetical protein